MPFFYQSLSLDFHYFCHMVKELQLRIQLKEGNSTDILLKKAAKHLSIDPASIHGIKVLRKSIDARKPIIYFTYKVAIYIEENLL